MSTSNKAVNVVATLQSSPEQAAALADVLAGLARASRVAPGNLRFEVHQQADDAGKFVTLEQWDSAAAADGHMASGYVGEALGKLGPLLTAPPAIVRYAQVV